MSNNMNTEIVKMQKPMRFIVIILFYDNINKVAIHILTELPLNNHNVWRVIIGLQSQV